MDKYEKCAASLMRLGDEILSEKKRRRKMILRRTAAVTLGTAAVLVIGVTTHVLKPPKKPVPPSSGIITETSAVTTAEAVTTEARTSSAASSLTTTASTAKTSTSTESHTTTTRAAEKPQSSTTTTAVWKQTTATSTTATSTATETTTSSPAATTALTQKTISAATLETTTTTQALTTQANTPSSPTTTRASWDISFPTYTTTAHPHAYNGHNYTTVSVGNGTEQYVKVLAECPHIIYIYSKTQEHYIKTAFIYDTDAEHSAPETATIYSLDGISERFAVMMYYPNIQAAPIYVRTEYEPETLGELLDDTGLSKYMTFDYDNAVVLNDEESRHVKDERITKVLDDCRSAANTGKNAASFSHDLTIKTDISYIGYDTTFIISKEGYIFTNITDKGASFYIGEEKALSCIEYLLGK